MCEADFRGWVSMSRRSVNVDACFPRGQISVRLFSGSVSRAELLLGLCYLCPNCPAPLRYLGVAAAALLSHAQPGSRILPWGCSGLGAALSHAQPGAPIRCADIRVFLSHGRPGPSSASRHGRCRVTGRAGRARPGGVMAVPPLPFPRRHRPSQPRRRSGGI